MALKRLNSGFATAKGRARIRRKKTLWTIMTTTLVVLLLFMGSGITFAWYTAQKNKEAVENTPVPKPVQKTISAPSKPAANTPVGVSITVLTSPLTAGSNASVTIKTKPLAACSIRVEYDKKASTDAGLVPKSADDFARCNFS